MHEVILALALAAGNAGAAPVPAPFIAINAEKASGFRDLAECRRAIGVSPGQAGASDRAGTLVNRAYGNRTRCEMVAGEPQVVVYLRGS